MTNRLKTTAVVRLVVLWGLMGGLLGCCLLWCLIGVTPGTIHTLARPMQAVVSTLGMSWSEGHEALLLHASFGLGGFVLGGWFRLRGLWRQFDDP